MRVITLFILFSFSLNATTLNIASYNVENLFDMQKDGTEYNQYIPNKHNWTRKILQKKLLNISEIICDINADIIGLQEVENENILKKLQKSLRTVGCVYKFLAIGHSKKSAIQVAVLSKLPIQSTKELEVSKKLGYRNILEVKFMIDAKPLYLYVNHWKSKRSAESSRMVSARALRKRLLSLAKGTDYILLGDFNSNYNEYENMEKKLNDTGNKTGINHILKTTLNYKMLYEKDMKENGFKHYNLWLELPNFQRWSHNFFGNKQGLDAMLIPPSLFDGKGIDYINDSFTVVKPAYLFHEKGYINRWQYKRERHVGKGYSDHLPIMAKFSTTAYYFDKEREKVVLGSIADLYQQSLSSSLYLKNIKVIFKRGHHAIIKQSKEGRAIFIYGAKGLEEGRSYDIIVYKTKSYRGLDEIVDFSIEYDYGDVLCDTYFYTKDLNFGNATLENEIVKDLEGVYRKNKFYVKDKVYPIFFKEKKNRPKDGTFLKLLRVQIGYYNKLQLVVWDADDFIIIR